MSQILSKDWNTSLVLEEFADNPFLAKFYESPDRYAFPVELSFLSERFSQLKNEITRDLFRPKVIADYFIAKCQIFASNNLKDDEWHLFNKMFDIVSNSLPQPDLIVYLYVQTERLQANIKKRGREFEQQISAEYLNNIQSQYLQYFQQHPELTVLMMDTSNIDFISDSAWLDIIKQHIVKKYKPGIHRLVIDHTFQS